VFVLSKVDIFKVFLLTDNKPLILISRFVRNGDFDNRSAVFGEIVEGKK
jgi:hypothetical protein